MSTKGKHWKIKKINKNNIVFTEVERNEIIRLYRENKNLNTLKEISKKFDCSEHTIYRRLFLWLGSEFKNERKRRRVLICEKANIESHKVEHSKKWKESWRVNKMLGFKIQAKMDRSEKQNEHWNKVLEKQRKQREEGKEVWISSWEDQFYTRLLKYFDTEDIKRQFYLDGLRHAFDFGIPSLKILIEIDGNYYHSFHQSRDKKINEFVQQNYSDWVLFRFNDEILKEANII